MSFFGIGQKIEKVIGKEQELLDASRNGNVDAVEKLLANRAKKSTTGGAFGQKLTSFLKNVNVNYTDKNGYTSLHHAAVNGHRDVVEALLKADAQPGLLDSQGCTPVHLAAWNGNAEIVMQLLMAGVGGAGESDSCTAVTPVNVNHQNTNGDTALHCAAQYGNVPVVDVLLQKHANPTIRNLNEESALDLASQYGRLEVVKLLLISFPELSQRPAFTQSPLHLASRNGHKEIVDELLKNNFGVQTVTETGSALHEAALHGKLDVVKILLCAGIDVHLCDKAGRTALQLLSAHQAQQKSFTEITQTIKDHMVKTNETESEVYDRLSNYASGEKPMATVRPLTPEKPVIKTPDKPSLSPRMSRRDLTPPLTVEPPSTPPYSKPNKEKLNSNPDRVISTASSVGEIVPPPLPPRMSVYPQDDVKVPANVPAKGSESPKMEGSPGTQPKTMVVPKKPPRQKKSPVPVRHSIIKPTPPSPDSPIASHPPAITENIPDTPINIPDVSLNSNVSSQHSPLTVDQSDIKDNSTHNSLGPTNQSDNKDGSSHNSMGPTNQSDNKDSSTHNLNQSEKKDNITHSSIGPTNQLDNKDTITHSSIRPTNQSDNKDNINPSSIKPTNQSDNKDNITHSSIRPTNQSDNKDNITNNLIGPTNQSESRTVVSSSPEVKHKPSLSPKPALPPRSSMSIKGNMSPGKDNSPKLRDNSVKDTTEIMKDISVSLTDSSVPVKGDNSVPPTTGSQDNQDVYMEMKPKPKPSPRQKPDEVKTETNSNTNSEKVDKNLKPAEIKFDNYGILFPNLKNVSPTKGRNPLITRSNTAPEENVYVEHSPTSPAEKFKEKHGLLRRINTAPEEQTYTSMTGLCDPDPHDPSRENEYAEIPEKSPPPVSPTENIYATIPEVKREIQSTVNTPMSETSSKPPEKESGTRGVKPAVSPKPSVKKRDGKGSNCTEEIRPKQPDVPKLPDRNGAEPKVHAKPTYLDFVKKIPSQPLTPTGYPQPPTPDFPPPSPATAMLGIELKIQEMANREDPDRTVPVGAG